MSCRLLPIVLILLLSACESSSPTAASTESSAERIAQVNKVMDDWHAAAANANAEQYFGMMSEDAIYLGTDKTERWTKAEFHGFAKPYFDKGKAWSFTAHDRHVQFSEKGDIAWIDEQLDTWMGPCRGSAVLRSDRSWDWQIVHYDLSYMVDNAMMDTVIALTGSAPPRVPKSK